MSCNIRLGPEWSGVRHIESNESELGLRSSATDVDTQGIDTREGQ